MPGVAGKALTTMKHALKRNALAAVVGLALAGAGGAVAAPVATASAQAATQQMRVYIIEFAEPGLLAHQIANTAQPASTEAGASSPHPLDTTSPAAVAWADHLLQRRLAHVQDIDAALGRDLVVEHHYSVTTNGVSAKMTAAEAARVARMPDVKSVRAAKKHYLTTYESTHFIGADKVWDGMATPDHVGNRGEGVVIAVLDSGANSGHPSFADDPSCGLGPDKPKLVAIDCDTSNASGLCNGFDTQAEPGAGHGVHTASTAAGNTIDNTVNPAPDLPDGISMSGVAPCAQVRSYKVCNEEGGMCGGEDIFAAIQTAIADGVDVINYSISGGLSPWADLDSVFLEAVHADIFVAASAGNNSASDREVVGRVNHLGPWMTTVAASTSPRAYSLLSVAGPGTPPDGLQNIILDSGSNTRLADVGKLHGVPMASWPDNLIGCTSTGGIPAGTFDGGVAIIRRGDCTFTEKINNAAAAGADVVIIANNEAGRVSMSTPGASLPSFSIPRGIGNALLNFIADHPGDATSDLDPFFLAGRGDVLGSFSYQGPVAAPLDNLTKPDITAPGVNIYAAVDPASGNYGYMSGTSMSSPHVAGAAALIRSVHPSWAPMEVQSALMTTAEVTGFATNGAAPWTIDEVGSGSMRVDRAVQAGLTLDESHANFLAAGPGGSLPLTDLNLSALRNMHCLGSCTFERTVRNRLDVTGTWETSFQGGDNSTHFVVAIEPQQFTLAPGATQEISITVTPDEARILAEPGSGEVWLTETAGQAPSQHLTLAIDGSGSPIRMKCISFAGETCHRGDGEAWYAPWLP